MSQRYAFWRQPNGRPARGTDGRCSPATLLADLGRESTLNASGGIGLSWEIHRYEAALNSRVVILSPHDEELNEHDTAALAWKAFTHSVKELGGQKPITESQFRAALDEFAAEFYRKTPERYSAVTGLSVNGVPFQSTTVNGCKIVPLSSRKSFPAPALSRSFPEIARHVESTRYRLVRIETTGRSHHDAMERALDALNLLRGFWTLYSTYRSWSVSFGGRRRKPIGVIHMGPIHTLHGQDGAPAGDTFWHEVGSHQDRDIYSPDREKWKGVERFRQWAQKKVEKAPFRRDLERLLIRYALALDDSDHNSAFLKMWGILEKITDTVGSSYDDTIKRAIWPFKDRDVTREFLESLRLRRNLYVHSAADARDSDQAAYLLKGFVDVHLELLIRNAFGVARLEDYARHLSLSHLPEDLKAQRQMLNRALQFMKMPPEA